ncbi:hypothetical protein C8J57DRAFT_1531448 [Mycena rebaudengoi]|nr:hypothetical protein C8J57DRAFT_1531448 [Mycena rebaudengoi]
MSSSLPTPFPLFLPYSPRVEGLRPAPPRPSPSSLHIHSSLPASPFSAFPLPPSHTYTCPPAPSLPPSLLAPPHASSRMPTLSPAPSRPPCLRPEPKLRSPAVHLPSSPAPAPPPSCRPYLPSPGHIQSAYSPAPPPPAPLESKLHSPSALPSPTYMPTPFLAALSLLCRPHPCLPAIPTYTYPPVRPFPPCTTSSATPAPRVEAPLSLHASSFSPRLRAAPLPYTYLPRPHTAPESKLLSPTSARSSLLPSLPSQRYIYTYSPSPSRRRAVRLLPRRAAYTYPFVRSLPFHMLPPLPESTAAPPQAIPVYAPFPFLPSRAITLPPVEVTSLSSAHRRRIFRPRQLLGDQGGSSQPQPLRRSTLASAAPATHKLLHNPLFLRVANGWRAYLTIGCN